MGIIVLSRMSTISAAIGRVPYGEAAQISEPNQPVFIED